MTQLVIDADYLQHRFLWNRTMDEAVKDAKQHLNDIQAELWADDILLVLAGKNNFRKEIYPEYKGHRPSLDEEKKKLFKEFRGLITQEYPHEYAEGQEADDTCAIRTLEHPDAILVSCDKDLLQVPCKVFNPTRWELTYVDEDMADYALHVQIIEGDRTDGILGVPGYGPVKAKKAIGNKPLGRRANRVKAVYRAQGLSKDYLQLQTDLIYIRRTEGDRYVLS